MTYNFIVDRIRKVVYSCKTQDQLNTANVYCKLLIKKWLKQHCSSDWNEYFERRRQRDDLLSWLYSIDMIHSLKTIPEMEKESELHR